MKSNAEIFRTAADYIREHGLWKGPLSGPPGGRCVWAAIDQADLMGNNFHLGRIVAERATGSRQLADLFRWNDMEERTAAEVVALLDGLAFDEELKAAAKAPTPETGDLVSQPQLQEVEA